MVGELPSVQDSFVRGDLLQKKASSLLVLFEYYVYGNVHVCLSIQDGFTPLMSAAYFNRSDAVKQLLQGGAKCNLQDKVFFT